MNTAYLKLQLEREQRSNIFSIQHTTKQKNQLSGQNYKYIGTVDLTPQLVANSAVKPMKKHITRTKVVSDKLKTLEHLTQKRKFEDQQQPCRGLAEVEEERCREYLETCVAET